ncbi:hypothetical protein [Frankia sp. AgB32]|uniref:hypothetical protein n=1 Tax=Frankia sp. AgB32 TaxID=631119 RepID=UPI00200E1A30|nr:hypothetical protein [Frankia sp. AgB32]MCK9896605.1 hypothetical protein [Frankia sp. AgB32]
MSEGTNSAGEAPTFVVDGYENVVEAIAALREHGVVIADFRGADDPVRRRIADALTGAGLANGNSPFMLTENVLFVTAGRMPNRAEVERYRDGDK